MCFIVSPSSATPPPKPVPTQNAHSRCSVHRQGDSVCCGVVLTPNQLVFVKIVYVYILTLNPPCRLVFGNGVASKGELLPLVF